MNDAHLAWGTKGNGFSSGSRRAGRSASANSPRVLPVNKEEVAKYGNRKELKEVIRLTP